MHSSQTPKSLLIKNLRPWGKQSVDMLIENGFIKKLEPNLSASSSAVEVLDAEHQLALPSLVNAHAHIDKNLLGLPWHKNQVAGPRIKDFVDFERSYRKTNAISVEAQSAKEVEASLKLGTTHIRTHVDIDTEAGLSNFEGVMKTKERYKDLMTLQSVAFPQSGMLIRKGTTELLEEALKQGADVMGGLDPSVIDRDPSKHLDIIFELAERYKVELDIHLHEPSELGAFSVELIIERTKALSMQNKVTISHCFCLGQITESYLDTLIEQLLENKISIMTLGSGGTKFPPIKKLYQAGVQLCTGTDGIRDTWSPYNNTDILERVKLLGYRSNYRKDEDIEMLLDIATQQSAYIMKDAEYGLSVGKRADLVLMQAETPAQAVIEQPTRSYVIKNGTIIVRNGELRSSK